MRSFDYIWLQSSYETIWISIPWKIVFIFKCDPESQQATHNEATKADVCINFSGCCWCCDKRYEWTGPWVRSCTLLGAMPVVAENRWGECETVWIMNMKNTVMEMAIWQLLMLPMMKISSFWWNFHHWQHQKLSFWQLLVQTVIKMTSKWKHSHFIELFMMDRVKQISWNENVFNLMKFPFQWTFIADGCKISRCRNSQQPDTQCYGKWGRATAYPIYHSPSGFHFSATFVQFLSEGLQEFGNGYHIEKFISPSCY